MLDQPEAQEPVDPGFGADLRTALAVWRRSPWMPVATVVLELLGFLALQHADKRSDAATPVFLLTLPAYIVAVSWPGVQRLWYLRMFRGKRLRIRETRGFVTAYFWRYAVLGMVVFLPLVMVVLVALGTGSLVGRVVAVVVLLALDFALTFVTPALAYTTRRVRVALRVGLSMIWNEWPRCTWFVVAPPLAVTVLLRAGARQGVGGGVRLAVLVTIPLLSLLCKGAVAVFYLRRWPTGLDGAAFVDADISLAASRHPVVPPHPPDQSRE